MQSYDITTYGAVGDGVTLVTDSIQRAIDACAETGGEVIIPSGTFLTGDILLRDNVVLHLLTGAVLLASRDPMEYFHYRKLFSLPAEDINDEPWTRQSIGESDKHIKSRIRTPGARWNNAIIRGLYAKNIAVIGDEGSLIDGNDTYDEFGEENYRGPHGMTLFGCTNVTLSGYTIQNTGNWAHNTNSCRNIEMRDVTVLAGHDGIHMSMCENVTIANSRFYTGDDCIAGFANINVLVSDCEINSACSAFRFGGTNMLARGCHIFGPARYCFRGSMSKEDKAASAPSLTGAEAAAKGYRTNMLSAFTYYSDYSLIISEQPGNIVIRDCKIEMADRFLHYNYSGNERWQQNRPLESIAFENISADGISMPLTAYGDKDVKIKLMLRNIDITMRGGSDAKALVHACNYERLELRDIKLSGFTGDTLVRTWSGSDTAVIESITCEGKCETVKDASEPFFAKAI